MWSAELPTSYIYNCHDITILTKIWEKIVFFFVGGSGVDGILVVTAPWGCGALRNIINLRNLLFKNSKIY